MALGRPMPPLVLSDDEVQQLKALASSRTLPHSLVRRAQIVLACGAGESNTAIAQRMGLTGMTVGKWRKRFIDQRLDGLHDEPRPGAERTITDDQVEQIVVKTLETTPSGRTHWSTRSMAKNVGLSHATIGRIWRTFGLKPHRTEDFRPVSSSSSWAPRSSIRRRS